MIELGYMAKRIVERPGWLNVPNVRDICAVANCISDDFWAPLSCNHLATEVRVNEHCLIDSLDYAIDRVGKGFFNNAEPGPYRIIAVNALEWPRNG